jgi:transposase
MTLNNWIKAFKASGSIALASQPKKPKNSKLSEENIQKIEEWIQVNSSITLRELRLKIIDELGVSVSTTTVHRVIQKLKFSYITPRPRHYKQDPLLQAEFKKKSTSDSKGES